MIATLLTTAALAACHATGAGLMVAPDNAARCTPGSKVVLSRAQACTPTDRPSLRASVRRDVLGLYGVPGWTGRDGEIDHRVPWFMTHDSSRRNLWPERGSIPNPKDKLEDYVYRRVCRSSPRPMRMRTARRIFLGDWRAYYRLYF